MAEQPARYRFIPFTKRDVVEMCVGSGDLDGGEAGEFRDVCRILTALFHFEYHDRLEALKEAYAPFHPDPDTRVVHRVSPEERRRLQQRLVDELTALLDAANFEEVTTADLGRAFEAESLLEIRLHVDFDHFDEVAFFRRGEEVRTATVRKLFGLWRKEIEFRNYDRVVVYVKFRDREHFEKPDDLPFEPGSTILKMFQNVPRADLEMLFPNSEVRMRTVDKLVIGVPAVVSGIAVLATKALATLGLLVLLLGVWLGIRDDEVVLDQSSLVGLGAGLGALGGYLAKQISKFKNRKIRFMKTLADNLYFKNLDNDAGVFHNLLDAAEEEETKEAVLAYWFLLTRARVEGRRWWSAREVDAGIERWFAEHWDCELDFEIDDALAKLERLRLVDRDGEQYAAVALPEAKARLDERWDGLFQWHQPTAVGATGDGAVGARPSTEALEPGS